MSGSKAEMAAVARAAVAANDTRDANPHTEYGTKPPEAGSGVDSSLPEAPLAQRHHPNDLLLAFGLLAIPVLVVCIVHSLLGCRKLKRAKSKTHKRTEALPSQHSQANDAESICVSSPPPIRRTKSKSVTWQSPFETKARKSHRTSTQHATPASDLHFVMVATPEKTHTPVQQFLHHQRTRNSRTMPPQQLVFTDDEDDTPQHHMDRLDSSPPLSDASRTPSSLSLSPWPSSPPLLQDNGEYDSDSPRISMSSVISDDPELVQRTNEAMRMTLQPPPLSEFSVEGTAGTPLTAHLLLRCSSSLDDFRHDLHHETTDEDLDMITRSSEYSF